MAEKLKIHVNLSSVILQARLKKGFATLKELYRELKPIIDYQTWLNAESGRRVPSAAIVTTIGEILQIDKQQLILAYCKDKFTDENSQFAIDALKLNKFVNLDVFFEAEEHSRTREYVFSCEELKAMKKDIRLRLFLTYTYDEEHRTTITRLANFFKLNKDLCWEVINKLEKMKLIEVAGEEIKKIHANTCIPNLPENYELRRNLLIESLKATLSESSYICNYHISVTEESYKRILSYLHLLSANLIKMSDEDNEKTGKKRIQIAIAGNLLSEGNENGKK